MIRNSKGSTILWAITIIMVLMITIAGGLTISYSYFQRSIQNNNKRQAYLTAKGIIENIVEKIETDNSEYVNLIPQTEGNSVILTIQLPEEANLGKVTKAVIKREEVENKQIRGWISIYVTVDYADEEEAIKADMQLGRTGNLLKWQLLQYNHGDEKSE